MLYNAGPTSADPFFAGVLLALDKAWHAGQLTPYIDGLDTSHSLTTVAATACTFTLYQ